MIERARELLRRGALDLPLPGAGATPERLERLFEVARADVALARIVEAHCDAVAILAEAGEAPAPGALYGVWASEGRGARVRLGPDSRVSGAKRFCSGGLALDRALVTAWRGEEAWLVEVSLDGASVRAAPADWATPAFASTETRTVRFERHPARPVGGPGFYLSRPGFWHGALAPAACWAGGARGIVDAAGRRTRDTAHALAHRGALEACAYACRAVLESAARECDAAPADARAAEVRALAVRQVVERQVTTLLDRAGRLLGPGPLAFDADLARRVAEVGLYVRQHHAERDLERLGRLLTAG